jgi:hypothetical protein
MAVFPTGRRLAPGRGTLFHSPGLNTPIARYRLETMRNHGGAPADHGRGRLVSGGRAMMNELIQDEVSKEAFVSGLLMFGDKFPAR